MGLPDLDSKCKCRFAGNSEKFISMQLLCWMVQVDLIVVACKKLQVEEFRVLDVNTGKFS